MKLSERRGKRMNCPKCGTDLNVTKVRLDRNPRMKSEEELRRCPDCGVVLAVGKTEIDAFMRGKLTHKMVMKYADIIFEGR